MKHSVKQGKNHRMALIAGVLTAILTYLMMRILTPILAQDGLLNSWDSIKSTPSRAARILGITGGGKSMKYKARIESRDGQIFSTLVCSDNQKCDPPQWKTGPTSSIPNSVFFSDTRASDCKNLGEFPLNPNGQIIECVYIMDTSIDLVPQVYFALMADSSLNYFVIDLHNYFRIQGKIVLTSLLMFFGMLLFVFRLTDFVAKQVQIKKKTSLNRQRANKAYTLLYFKLPLASQGRREFLFLLANGFFGHIICR